MKTQNITFTTGETAMMRKHMMDAQRVSRRDLKSYNYCRRAIGIIEKAERRNRRPKVSRLLMDENVLKDIFAGV